ncbi:glycosyltransferase family 2 protein [Leuconostoc citreum]|uniref:glycosyltransferase family 2 protein n=1 Tax=Leuconostoc citreum TaxID=33964 RepID=UPI00209FC177|nr:glycosyltransferase family 2 protein [Leuconostoc citreum]MCP1276153.1 glycosyltransferase family 2 protein [Leuconostoc citreum]
MKKILKKILFKKNDDRNSDKSLIKLALNKLLSTVMGIVLIFQNYLDWRPKRIYQAKKSGKIIDRKLYILAIIKNEGNYLDEWIYYHRAIGVDGFIIYDNESTDNSKAIIDKHSQFIDIDYHFFPGKSKQIEAYQDAIEKYREKQIWILTIDVDEFLRPINDTDIKTWLQSFPKKVSQILVPWTIYGSANHVSRPAGLVIENYPYHSNDQFITEYKSFVKPELVRKAFMGHFYKTIGKIVSESGKKLWYYPYVLLVGSRPSSKNFMTINHYYCKSVEDFEEKIKRGDVFDYEKNLRNFNEFKIQDKNDILDVDVSHYIDKITNLKNSDAMTKS